jgi:trehalose-phosphatase
LGDRDRELRGKMKLAGYRAIILDLDGVVTRTASLHARAWKETLDAFLATRNCRPGENCSPFDIDSDYHAYVDGKPRLDGIRSFLESRAIELPEGDTQASAEDDTIAGLGERKNAIFLELLSREEVQTFEDAIEQIERWKSRGLPLALVTSSRNGRSILRAAKLDDHFQVILDGADAARLGLPGKPAPDIFLHAARLLGVEPDRAVVVEDAVSGVQAGRAGGFGCVIGIDRQDGARLRDAGADLVLRDLRDVESVDEERAPSGAAGSGTPARELVGEVLATARDRKLVLFFDYDGTLTPIVRRPELATLPEERKALLETLARRVPVAVVSGRDLDDVREMVGLEGLIYAGSHGFDVHGPAGLRLERGDFDEILPELDRAEAELVERLGGIDGVWVERKRFAIAVHFREAPESAAERVERIVDEVRSERRGLRKKAGKKIFEVQPDIEWDKGRAVLWLLESLGLDGTDVLPIYFGDDVTDEDAFRALEGRGLGIRIGSPEEPTAAGHVLHDVDELEVFLRELLRRLTG